MNSWWVWRILSFHKCAHPRGSGYDMQVTSGRRKPLWENCLATQQHCRITRALSPVYLLLFRRPYLWTEGEGCNGFSGIAVVANLYIEHFEQLVLESAPYRPRLWKRYVDDTCCIIRSEAVEEFHQHINSICPSIWFTAELESDGALLFLDTYLQWRGDGSLDISVYRKRTHTSNHPGYVNENSSNACLIKLRRLLRMVKLWARRKNTWIEFCMPMATQMFH